MSNLNSFHGQGNLTEDPVLMGKEQNAVRFTIAINNGYGDYKSTTFVDCVGFGKSAGIIAEHFKKGKQVIVAGMLEQRKWQTDDGENRSRMQVKLNMIDGFFFVSGDRNSSGEAATAAAGASAGEDSKELF